MKTPEELKSQKEMLDSIDKLIRGFPSNTPTQRFNPRRIELLASTLERLGRYQELQMELQVTLKGMRTAIEKELQLVRRKR